MLEHHWLLTALIYVLNVAKCNLGKVNLKSMYPVVFLTKLICMQGGRRGLPCHVLTNQPYSPCALALRSQQCFYSVSLANLPLCPSLPCWKSASDM